uniref:Uncharacterized protein n=1 Tax=viral metagenome TaxID=1070528 RepID=A0A6H1ZJK2_9ZZZZ
MSKKSKRRKLTRHHNINRHNGGTDAVENIIMLKNRKHEYWHILFGDKTFAQAGRLLLRADKMKRKEGKNWKKTFETNYG